MTALFRLDGSRPRAPEVDAWFGRQAPELAALARTWFDRIRRTGDDVRELLHDGCPTACVGDAAFAYVNAFTRHVNVGFFRGALLPDAAGLLQGHGRLMRHVKLHPGTPVDEAALAALITAAHDDIVAQLAASR